MFFAVWMGWKFSISNKCPVSRVYIYISWCQPSCQEPSPPDHLGQRGPFRQRMGTTWRPHKLWAGVAQLMFPPFVCRLFLIVSVFWRWVGTAGMSSLTPLGIMVRSGSGALHVDASRGKGVGIEFVGLQQSEVMSSFEEALRWHVLLVQLRTKWHRERKGQAYGGKGQVWPPNWMDAAMLPLTVNLP